MGPLALMAAGAGANAIGGIIGGLASKGDREAATAAYQHAQDLIMSIGAPPELARAIIYQQFQQAGVLTPEMEHAINQDTSALAGVKGNAQLQQAQQNALQLMQQRGTAGLSPQDRANIAQIQAQVNAQNQGNQQAIIQNMQQRGVGGSGAELAARLIANQQSANQMSNQGLQVAGQASQNALQAIAASGGMASGMEGQQFGEQSQAANAQDQLNRFNIQNQLGQQQRNVGASNQAQQMNLAQKQAIQNANVQQYNQEQIRQREAEQQVWQDKLAQAQAAAGMSANIGQAHQNNATAAANMWSGIGSSVGQGLGAVGQYQANQDYMNQSYGNNNQNNYGTSNVMNKRYDAYGNPIA